SVSMPNDECHTRPPEGELLGTEAEPAQFAPFIPPDAPEIPCIPAQTDSVREKPVGPAADVHCRQCAGDWKDAGEIVDVCVHEPGADDEVRPECVLGPMPG